MAKARLVGKDALVEGNAYDIPKVVNACETLVDALTKVISPPQPILTMHHEGSPRYPLPEPGRKKARAAWENMHSLLDVCDEPLVYLLGGVTLKVYVLGKTWTTLQRATGKILGPHNRPLEEMDNTPTVCVYGELLPEFNCGVLTSAAMDDIEDAVESLAHLGLQFERVNADPQGLLSVHDKTQFAFITFPHAVYGAGRKDLLIRCVCDDGQEIDAKTASPLN